MHSRKMGPRKSRAGLGKRRNLFIIGYYLSTRQLLFGHSRALLLCGFIIIALAGQIVKCRTATSERKQLPTREEAEQQRRANNNNNNKNDDDDGQIIQVISSRHSSNLLSRIQAHPHQQRRHTAPLGQWPTQASSINGKVATVGGQQPSQEFEAGQRQFVQARWPPSQQAQHKPTNWSQHRTRAPVAQKFAPQQQHQGAPYALGSTQSVQEQRNSVVANNSTNGTLIRDTSLLIDAQPGEQQAEQWQQQQQQQLSVVRDNHAGTLRSRFELAAGAQVSLIQPGRTHSDQQWQQAKAARGQPSGAQGDLAMTQAAESSTTTTIFAATQEPTSSTRRNSKFKSEQVAANTTPLSSSSSNSSTATTSAPPEPEVTGSGQVLALNETDLASLYEQQQRFEIDALQRETMAPQTPATGAQRAADSIQVVNNNHSQLGASRGRQGAATQAIAASKQSGARLARKLDQQQSGASQRGLWTATLPGLLQRTLGGLVRRLIGAGGQMAPSSSQQQVATSEQQQSHSLQQSQQQQQQYTSLLVSALTSVAAAALRPQPSGGGNNMMKQFQAIPPVGDSQNLLAHANRHQMGASSTLLHEARRPPLGQHANKKIIDSLVDLPASERRTGLAQSSSSFEQTKSSSTTGFDEARLAAEPRAEQAKRMAKTSKEWKLVDGENESEVLNQDFGNQEQAADQFARLNAANENQEHDNQGAVAPEEEGEILTRSSAPIVDEEQDQDDENKQEDDNNGEDGLPSANAEQVSGADPDELEAEASDEESAPVFYAPHSSLLLRADGNEQFGAESAAATTEEQTRARKRLSAPHVPKVHQVLEFEPQENGINEEEEEDYAQDNHADETRIVRRKRRRPTIRRPPMVPIEPVEYQQPAGGDDDDEQLTTRVRPRRRPSSGSHLQAHQQNKLTVAPIELAKVTRNKHKTTGSSAAPRPMHLLAPQLMGADLGGARPPSRTQMAPMSSSINVMDLHPSMTRLAHNKLIVAKHKKQQPVAGASRRTTAPLRPKSGLIGAPSRGATSSTSAAPLVRSSQQFDWPTATSAPESGLQPLQLERLEAPGRAVDPLSLASVVLNGRGVISNKHISDILSRWTRPATIQSSSTTSRPITSTSPTVEPQTTSESYTSVEETEMKRDNSGDSAEWPLDARIAPSNQQGAQQQQQQQQQAARSPLSPPGTSHNDKFNFSLVQMNNRERVNPLVLPMDTQRPGATNSLASSSTQARLKTSQTRPRPSSAIRTTSSTTSTSTTTTTTSTTSRPRSTSSARPQRPATSSVKPATARPLLASTQAPEISPIEETTSTTSSIGPGSVLLDNDDDDEEFGQIVRSQHLKLQLQRQPKPSLSEQQRQQQAALRLRNQYLALVGGRSNVSAISGHISLPSDSLVLAVGNNEANRYELSQGDANQQPALGSDHSIVIMSDNHHQVRRRRPPPSQLAAGQQVAPALVSASMHYAASQTTVSLDPLPATTEAPAQLQLASKYLEEFVNGSRIRPSSLVKLAAAAAAANQSASVTSGEQLGRAGAEQQTNVQLAGEGSPLVVTTNHAAVSGRPPVSRDASNRTTNGSSGSLSSADLVGKLDEHAHELLLDLFDRNPVYSAQTGAAQNGANARASNRDQLQRIYAQMMLMQASSSTSAAAAATEQATTPAPSTTPATNLEWTSRSSAPTAAADQQQQARSTESLARFQESTSLPAPLTSDSFVQSARASIRNSQAKIQALLMDFARRNATSRPAAATTTSADDSSDLLDLAAQYARPSGAPVAINELETSKLATGSMQNGDNNNNSIEPETGGAQRNQHVTAEDTDTQGEQHSTRFYSPLTSTTAAAFQAYQEQQRQRQKLPLIESLSAGRQKINRPPADSPDYLQSEAVLGHSTTPMPHFRDEGAQANSLAGLADHAPQEPNNEDALRPTSAAETTSLPPNESGGAPYNRQPTEQAEDQLQELEAHRRPARPVIIRRRPAAKPASSGGRRKQASAPSSVLVKPVRLNSIDSHHKHDQALQKKRRKQPSRRPTPPVEVLVHDNEDDDEATQPVFAPQRGQLPSQLVFIPQKAPTVNLIRRRPAASGGASVRLPPDSIQIHSDGQAHNRSQQEKGAHISAPISILLPSSETHSTGEHQHLSLPYRRKDQDVRTRPLTIVDHSPGANDRRHQQEPTTILHENMVVTYRPGRPLPPLSFVSTRPGGGTHSQRPSGPNSIHLISTSTTASGHNSTDEHYLVPSRVQLGSGNGGDTLLVSIEQQQATMATRRPDSGSLLDDLMTSTTTTMSSVATSLQETTTTIASTTMPPTTTSATQSMTGAATQSSTGGLQFGGPHRPIIVINGLTFDHLSHSSNNHSSQNSHKSKPAGASSLGGNTLLEAGSMSVVAAASHGPTGSNKPSQKQQQQQQQQSSGGSWSSSSRHNNTLVPIMGNGAGSSAASNHSSSNDNNGDIASSSSQQTADSVVGPEMPNFGSSFGNSFSSSPSSGTSSTTIGMPHFGSLPAGSRPPSQANRPAYSWRVRKRPNGNSGSSSSNNSGGGNPYKRPAGASNAPYDYSSASSSSSISNIVYRPFQSQSLAQVFSWNTVKTAFDNMQIFLARMRTFLISLMVMFLPPLALTASIVNAMSSS